jgi:hypothetical protein
VFAAFHVYAHLTLFAMVAEQREAELSGEYGPVRETVGSLRAFERAWYLGERLKEDCWELLGTAGRQMVEWLLAALEFMNPSSPPSGADIHLYLDRYVRESREAEGAFRDARSDPALAERLAPLAQDEVDAARALLATNRSTASSPPPSCARTAIWGRAFRSSACSSPRSCPMLRTIATD